MTMRRQRSAEVEWDLLCAGIFSPASVALIVSSVGGKSMSEVRQKSLAGFLNNAVKDYFLSRRQEEQPTAKQRVKAARRLAAACANVLNSCGVGRDADVDHILPSLGSGGLFAVAARRSPSGGRDAVQKALDGVRALHAYATSLEAFEASRAPRWEDNTVVEADLRPARQISNKGNPAFAQLIEALNEAFLHWWIEIPGRGQTDTGENSPFIRFLLNVTNHIAVSLPGSFRKKSAGALASAWRRTRAPEDMAKLKEIISQLDHAPST